MSKLRIIYSGTPEFAVEPLKKLTDNGYHIPYCIYKQLLARKYLQITERTDNNGNPYTHTREVKEYTIEVLPPLTEAELKQLADKQLAAGYDAAE